MARAFHEPIGISNAMVWGHRCPTHGEKAKPLEGRAAEAHFGSCVFVCLCVCVVVLWACLAFSYLTCKKVKTDWGFGLWNGWLIHIHNRKGITEAHPYYRMSIIVRVWGWWTFAHIYVWALLWRDMIGFEDDGHFLTFMYECCYGVFWLWIQQGPEELYLSRYSTKLFLASQYQDYG